MLNNNHFALFGVVLLTVACGNDAPPTSLDSSMKPDIARVDARDASPSADGADEDASADAGPAEDGSVDATADQRALEQGAPADGSADGPPADGLPADGLTADGLTADGLTADGLTGDPCQGKMCNTPPAAVCLDALQLQTFQSPGSCSAGSCFYVEQIVTCPFGCTAGACTGDPCAGVTCASPPANVCINPLTLRSFSAHGSCAGGSCSYTAQEVTCPHGCAAGACSGDPCLGKSCNSAPAAYCSDSTTLRSFEATGHCVGGSCSYPASATTCPFGCQQGACLGDPCAGKTCATPPAPSCKDANTLRRYATPGQCAGGACSYTPQDVVCQHGCLAGQCKADPCAGITCNSPPQDGCIDSQTLRTYSTIGRCSAGACQYSYVDQVCPSGCVAGKCQGPTCGATTCGSPPASACQDGTRLNTYAPIGSCQSGSCDYQQIRKYCSQGCFAGACLPGSYAVEEPPVSLYRQRAMVVDAAGNVHLAGCQQNGDIAYLHRTTAGWTVEVIDPALAFQDCNVAIALLASGQPVFAYQDPSNEDVRFARRTGPNSFSLSLVATSGSVGDGVAIVVDKADQVLVGFTDNSRSKTVVASQVGTSWQAIDVGPSPFGLDLDVQMIFDVNGSLHLISGDSRSHRKTSSSYAQPAATYVRRDATGRCQGSCRLVRHAVA
jgi:hypothetical protein